MQLQIIGLPERPASLILVFWCKSESRQEVEVRAIDALTPEEVVGPAAGAHRHFYNRIIAKPTRLALKGRPPLEE